MGILVSCPHARFRPITVKLWDPLSDCWMLMSGSSVILALWSVRSSWMLLLLLTAPFCTWMSAKVGFIAVMVNQYIAQNKFLMLEVKRKLNNFICLVLSLLFQFYLNIYRIMSERNQYISIFYIIYFWSFFGLYLYLLEVFWYHPSCNLCILIVSTLCWPFFFFLQLLSCYYIWAQCSFFKEQKKESIEFFPS